MAKLGDMRKHHSKETFLYCDVCGSKHSSNPDDYFDYSDDHDISCCGNSLLICRNDIVTVNCTDPRSAITKHLSMAQALFDSHFGV